ncbi:MAG: FAD-binding oxidoreductase [Myxococcales bacterium]
MTITSSSQSPVSAMNYVAEGTVDDSETTRDFRDKITEFVIRHRWASVVPVVLPLSKVYDTYWQLRHVTIRNLTRQVEKHDSRVAEVSAQIKRWIAAGKPGLLHTSRKSWQSVSVRAIEYKKNSPSGIDVDLHDILELDTERRTVRVEPRVNMAQLTAFLAPRGWTVPVVPELDDLTVGGLVLGYGIESSSHKYGLFADTVRAMEVVLGDGRVVRATPQEHADLFYALPWSYGGLGMLTAVELPIIPCKPYVKLTYVPVKSQAEACSVFGELVCRENPPEFVDALLYTKDTGVIVVGDFADLPPGEKPNRIGNYYKPWFYKHMESFLEKGEATEYVPLRDYYHRYTRSLYWHGELLVPIGNHPLFRYTLGWLMPPKVSLMRLTQTKRMRKFRDERNVVQDALLPLRFLSESIDMFHQEFECYPVWLCPHKVFKTQPQGALKPSLPGGDEMFVDVGVWQVPGFVKRKEKWNGRVAVKRMEAWLRAHHGYQCLYAVTEQTRKQFWEMFDGTLYHKARKTYGGEGAFMDVFDKVKRPEQA